MIQPGTNALIRCGRVSVSFCRYRALWPKSRRFTDSFTDSGQSDFCNSLIYNR